MYIFIVDVNLINRGGKVTLLLHHHAFGMSFDSIVPHILWIPHISTHPRSLSTPPYSSLLPCLAGTGRSHQSARSAALAASTASRIATARRAMPGPPHIALRTIKGRKIKD
jgi:hypothetical protein